MKLSIYQWFQIFYVESQGPAITVEVRWQGQEGKIGGIQFSETR